MRESFMENRQDESLDINFSPEHKKNLKDAKGLIHGSLDNNITNEEGGDDFYWLNFFRDAKDIAIEKNITNEELKNILNELGVKKIFDRASAAAKITTEKFKDETLLN